VIELVGSQDERRKALCQRERLKERLRRLKKQYGYLEVEEEEYQHKKRQLESALLGFAIPEGNEALFAGAYLESLGDAWHATSPEERRDKLRFMLVAVYADTTTTRIVALKREPQLRATTLSPP
jgi:hypothetical protein